MGFTKLSSDLLDSTIWREPYSTRLVWITMLAKADRNGRVHVSLPALVDLARVTMEECEAALKTLSEPDKYSRTKDFDGSRIMEDVEDGGWILLNYLKFRAIEDVDQKREMTKLRVRKHRSMKDDVTCEALPSVTVTLVTPVTQCNGIAEAEAECRSRPEAFYGNEGNQIFSSNEKELPIQTAIDKAQQEWDDITILGNHPDKAWKITGTYADKFETNLNADPNYGRNFSKATHQINSMSWPDRTKFPGLPLLIKIPDTVTKFAALLDAKNKPLDLSTYGIKPDTPELAAKKARAREQAKRRCSDAAAEELVKRSKPGWTPPINEGSK